MHQALEHNGYSVRLIRADQSVSAMEMRIRACASIDRVDDAWWISRVSIPNPEHRGKGLGSFMLKAALAAVFELDPEARVFVAPSGYGSDSERQFAFYERLGFVQHGHHALGVLVVEGAKRE